MTNDCLERDLVLLMGRAANCAGWVWMLYGAFFVGVLVTIDNCAVVGTTLRAGVCSDGVSWAIDLVMCMVGAAGLLSTLGAGFQIAGICWGSS